METKKKVGIWIRVSTEDQAKGESPEHHEKRASYYAKAKEWEVIKVYNLRGVSGKSVMDHPETKRMLADVQNKRITGLIFSKLARLTRNLKELLDFSEIFQEHNASMISLGESIDTSTPAGRLFYAMIAAMAQWEREEIAGRVAASVPIRAKLGKPLGGAAPFGYRWLTNGDGKATKLAIDEHEAPIRKFIFELFSKHKRKKTVAGMLTKKGYRTRNGSKFSDTTIDRLLTDPIAKGTRRVNYTKSLGVNKKWEIKPESDWVYNDVPPIVSDDLWNACNTIIDEQRKKNKRKPRGAKRLFAGLVYCHCGTKMYVSSYIPKGLSPNYKCEKCKNKIALDDLEEIYYVELQTFLINGGHIEEYLKKADSLVYDKAELLSSHTNEKEKLEKEMDRLVKLHSEGELPTKGFNKHYNPLFEQAEQIELQIPEIQAEIDFLKIEYLSGDQVLKEAHTIYDRWPKLELHEKQLITEDLTEKITIGSDEIQFEFNYTPVPRSSNKTLTKEQHNNMDALPFCKITLNTLKSPPRSLLYPIELNTLGDHIRKRRLELGLLQRDVAKIMGVCEDTITGWETGRSNPSKRLIGSIIKFLNYNPFD